VPDTFDRLKAALADRYAIQHELGSGGMATVYLAEDLKHHRKVAVKVLRPELAAVLGAERFLKEIEVTANLNHPHILPLFDSGRADGFLYYVMPYIEGESLRDRLEREKQLPIDDALQIASEVADGLSYAHSFGVIHRDIKPENILLSEGHAVVADFGIAKAISTAGGDDITRTGFAVGTPGYMSPEQAAGNTQLDARTDVFSLACVVYEMLVAETPGLWPTDEAVRLGRFIDAPPAHRERLERLPVVLEQALTKAMAMRAQDRFATPTELVHALAEQPGSKRKYGEREVREIVQLAADAEVTHRTETGALSLGGLQQIGAEVGIPPERIKEAAHAVDRPAEARLGKGLLGASSKIDLERVIECEVPEEGFEAILEDIRGAMGEAGRINPTLGKSLSWNSLSFQNTFEGSGRLTHVIVSPKGGKTKIRITEGGGQHMALLGATVAVGSTAGIVLTATVGAPVILLIPIVGAMLGGSYMTARTVFRRIMARRHRVLHSLLERISIHVAETGTVPVDRALTPGDHE